MFRAKKLENKEQKTEEITFGCQVTTAYKERYIIDSANCFKVCPDGRLSLKTNIIGFGKVYSLRRLHPDHADELTRDVHNWLLTLDNRESILQTSYAIARFLCQQVITNLIKFLLKQFSITLKIHSAPDTIDVKFDDDFIEKELSIIIKEKRFRKDDNPINAICMALVIKKIGKEALINNLRIKNTCYVFTVSNRNSLEWLANIHQTLRLVLDELFEEEIAKTLQTNIIAKSKNELNLATEIIRNPNVQNRRISSLISAVISSLLAQNKNRAKEFIRNLQQEIKPASELKMAEKAILNIIEQKLMPSELKKLESKKTTLIVLPDLKSLNADYESRAQYLPAKNTIFVKQDCVNGSLVHEIQHSLGKDISPLRPISYFRFYKSCKTLTVRSGSICFTMADELAVIAHENRAKTEPDNKRLQYKIKRAKYVLSLYNYRPHERDSEILAHLRQFIADFGKEETAKILPRLYQYWFNEVVKTYAAVEKEIVRPV